MNPHGPELARCEGCIDLVSMWLACMVGGDASGESAVGAEGIAKMVMSQPAIGIVEPGCSG